jgi:hypothetical protein
MKAKWKTCNSPVFRVGIVNDKNRPAITQELYVDFRLENVVSLHAASIDKITH